MPCGKMSVKETCTYGSQHSQSHEQGDMEEEIQQPHLTWKGKWADEEEIGEE